MNSIIIGNGEIGKSLHEIISGDIIDKTDKICQYDVIHICFPYSDEFVSEVKRYQELFKPQYTVIHSTVPVGTSRKCNAIHSPVIGMHPYLAKSIKTFTKFLGGKNAGVLANYFRKFNIKVYITDKSETTELMKLLCTARYGMDIEFTKDVKRQCKKYKVPFELFTLWTDNYNNGYTELGQKQFIRPNLIPIMEKIGGHCVIPNTQLIKTKFTKFLDKANK